MCYGNTHFQRLVVAPYIQIEATKNKRYLHRISEYEANLQATGKREWVGFSFKSIIDSPQWNNAWVWLLYTGTGSWFNLRKGSQLEKSKQELKAMHGNY